MQNPIDQAKINRQSKLKTKLANINQNISPEKVRGEDPMDGIKRNSNIKQKILNKYSKNPVPDVEALAI